MYFRQKISEEYAIFKAYWDFINSYHKIVLNLAYL